MYLAILLSWLTAASQDPKTSLGFGLSFLPSKSHSLPSFGPCFHLPRPLAMVPSAKKPPGRPKVFHGAIYVPTTLSLKVSKV